MRQKGSRSTYKKYERALSSLQELKSLGKQKRIKRIYKKFCSERMALTRKNKMNMIRKKIANLKRNAITKGELKSRQHEQLVAR